MKKLDRLIKLKNRLNEIQKAFKEEQEREAKNIGLAVLKILLKAQNNELLDYDVLQQMPCEKFKEAVLKSLGISNITKESKNEATSVAKDTDSTA